MISPSLESLGRSVELGSNDIGDSGSVVSSKENSEARSSTREFLCKLLWRSISRGVRSREGSSRRFGAADPSGIVEDSCPDASGPAWFRAGSDFLSHDHTALRRHTPAAMKPTP